MKKKVFSLLLAGMLTFSMGTTAYATEDAIADMQAQKQQAEAGHRRILTAFRARSRSWRTICLI